MLIFSWALIVVYGTLSVWSLTTNGKTDEVPHRRSVFYAGGRYDFDVHLNGTILLDQMYVEQLTPLNGIKQRYPLVFLHGGGISGTQWLNKPDGGRGWASYFLNEGYEVFLVDLWSVGRSSSGSFPQLFVGSTVELAQRAFTAPEKYKGYYQARFHTQWPGTGLKDDPVFDTFYAQILPLAFSATQENITRTAVCTLLSQVGPSILISHSAGSSAGLLATDGCPRSVKAHVSVEGAQTPFGSYVALVSGNPPVPLRKWGIADVPIAYDPPVQDPDKELVRAVVGRTEYTDGLVSRYSCIIQAEGSNAHIVNTNNTAITSGTPNPPPPPRKLANISQSPILYLTTQASVHAVFNECSVRFLRQAGVDVTWTKLAEVGILGNGHFSMLERNSDAVAGLIERWIKKLG